MALAPPPATSQPPELELAPLRLPWDLRLTPEQFERVCQANPEAVLELRADGHLIVMTPTGGETGSRNSRLLIQLGIALSCCKLSLRIFDSSTGFRLPDGSVLSPDAALLLEERWLALTPQQRRGFPPLCPDLVLELASPSDEGPRGVSALRRKMDQYQANGARLGWLLLPEERAVEIWREGQQGMAERLDNTTRLDGAELAEGLALELEEIWGV
ncbi:Uma2 family endonuclease [Synechococcus sp. BA-132 BA5]|uniref:Uma2 family endonuclease n=1 Tax=Synechococcus sp. BA-132 BA5 TaxID=3110252 RepID=UPI002B1EB26C|nr:Uma2 family endonuclease [Synechococcus sp. BA-132 BA5]MEA5415863.1 Uma2 family endonuclease [Synechococcus sp. BA-132 BA5]